MLIFFGLAALIVLLVLSIFWSAAETALTSLSKYRVKKLIAVNKSISAFLGQWLKSPYYLLTTILVGNTTNDLLFSSVATVVILHIFTPYFAVIPRGFVEVADWLAVSFVLLVFGGMVPKVFARRNPEKVTLMLLPALTRIMNVSRVVISPLTATLKFLFPKLNLVPVGRLSYI